MQEATGLVGCMVVGHSKLTAMLLAAQLLIVRGGQPVDNFD